jgi:hypothetical protein
MMKMMMMMIVKVFTLLGRTGFLGVADLKKCFFLSALPTTKASILCLGSL